MTHAEAVTEIERMLTENAAYRKTLRGGEDYEADRAECQGEATGLRSALQVFAQVKADPSQVTVDRAKLLALIEEIANGSSNCPCFVDCPLHSSLSCRAALCEAFGLEVPK